MLLRLLDVATHGAGGAAADRRDGGMIHEVVLPCDCELISQRLNVHVQLPRPGIIAAGWYPLSVNYTTPARPPFERRILPRDAGRIVGIHHVSAGFGHRA